jgi:RNA polymerase sigma-70 factor (ECF subfamily)
MNGQFAIPGVFGRTRANAQRVGFQVVATPDASRGDAPAAEQTDAELVAESVRTPRAFMPVVERHQRVLYGYLARRVGADLAEEITAETFTRAFAQRDRYDPRWPDARPWLFGIALNLMRTHLRSEGRRLRAYSRQGTMDAAELQPDTTDTDTRLDASAQGPKLAAALAALSAGDREVLLLFAWGDMAYDDIAETLDIPVGTVRSRLNRARRVVREHLGADGAGTDTGAASAGRTHQPHGGGTP